MDIFFKDEKGQIISLIAIAFAALLGCTAMVTDVGLIISSKFELAHAVDAAALAGVQELPDEEKAIELAIDYASCNVPSIRNVDVQIINKNKIIVSAEKNVNLFFAQILGFNEAMVAGEAAAVKGGLVSYKGAAPLIVAKRDFVFGEEYVLKQGAHGSDFLGPGNFGAIDLVGFGTPGSGANAYRYNLEYGYGKELKVGDIVPLESGNMSDPTIDGVTYRFLQCTCECTHENINPQCSRLIIVPLYDPIDIDPESEVRSLKICGFAAFLLTEIPEPGHENYIKGCFVRTIPSPDASFEIDPLQKNYGLESFQLCD